MPPFSLMGALQNKGPMMEPEIDEEEADEPQYDPRASSPDGNTLFLDKDMFPKGCKIGDRVKITAVVTKHGEKYGVKPEDIERAQDGGLEEGSKSPEGGDDY